MPVDAASISYVKGIHNIKLGINYEHTFLTENDTIGLVDPTANAVCLNSDGSPFTGASLTDPGNCSGALSPNPNFVPLLACYDLTRTGKLPASDGCPNSTSGSYLFNGRADIKELALYLQDTISLKNWTFNLGIRGDLYNGITVARQAEPRGRYRLQHQANQHRTASLLRPHHGNAVQREYGSRQPRLQ